MSLPILGSYLLVDIDCVYMIVYIIFTCCDFIFAGNWERVPRSQYSIRYTVHVPSIHHVGVRVQSVGSLAANGDARH